MYKTGLHLNWLCDKGVIWMILDWLLMFHHGILKFLSPLKYCKSYNVKCTFMRKAAREKREPWRQFLSLSTITQMVTDGKWILEESKPPQLYLQINGVRRVTIKEKEEVGPVNQRNLACLPKLNYSFLKLFEFYSPVQRTVFWIKHWIQSYVSQSFSQFRRYLSITSAKKHWNKKECRL